MAVELLRIARAGKRQAKRVALTKTNIEALQPPTGGGDRVYVYDTRQPNLALAITAAGTRTFYLVGRVGGRPSRIRLGAYPAMTPEQARRSVKLLLADIVDGHDPQAAKRVARGEMTVGELFDARLEQYWKPHARPRTRREAEADWRRYMQQWRNRKLSDLTRLDVREWHARLGRDHGPVSANRALAMLKAIFNFASSELDLTIENPAAGVRRFREQTRERFLTADELRRLMAALDAPGVDGDARDAVKIMLFTGLRRGNVFGLRWQWLDLDAATYTIPGAAHKTHRAVTNPLTAEALAILTRRRQADPDGEWVFPAKRVGGPLTDITLHWRRIRRAADIPDITLHDLRRSFASWQLVAGGSLVAIGRALGHAAGSKATSIYSRLDLAPIRASVQAAATAMMAAANGAGVEDGH